MKLIRILDLICNDQETRYSFRKTTDGDYEIEDLKNNLGAVISEDGDISYYVTGVYNNCTNWEEINIEGLTDLKNLCEPLAENMKEGDSE